ncbi:MAG: MarR family transcriptional regulator [Sulfurovaceae bacterium]|nr:MarR family transcriptional regulator [Sulfurovaceae bacterium]
MTNYDIDQSLGYMLSKVVSRMRMELLKNMRDMDITTEQRHVIMRLYNHDGITQKELSKLTSYDPSSITLILDKLELKKLVKRERCEKDRRVFKVYLTTKAKSIKDKLIEAGLQTQNKAMVGISNDELSNFRDICQKIYNNLSMES